MVELVPSASQPVKPTKEPGRVKVERPVAVRAPSGSEVRASPRKLESEAQRKEKQRQRWLNRDEEAFGTPVDTFQQPDFDFEGNLALFDKKAVSYLLFGYRNAHYCGLRHCDLLV